MRDAAGQMADAFHLLGLRQLLLCLLQRFLGIAPIRDVARYFSETYEIAAMIADRSDQHICPELRAVLSDAPPEGLEPPVLFGLLQRVFRLPGGPIFITEGLLRLLKTEGEVAGVLGHEIGHVIARHSAERLAKAQLTQGLITAVMMGSGDYTATQLAQMVGGMINMKYGREDELESDALGVRNASMLLGAAAVGAVALLYVASPVLRNLRHR